MNGIWMMGSSGIVVLDEVRAQEIRALLAPTLSRPGDVAAALRAMVADVPAQPVPLASEDTPRGSRAGKIQVPVGLRVDGRARVQRRCGR